MDNVYNATKPRTNGGHYMKNRRAEILLGVFLFLLGALLLFDAFDARGKKIPWPMGAVMPW